MAWVTPGPGRRLTRPTPSGSSSKLSGCGKNKGRNSGAHRRGGQQFSLGCEDCGTDVGGCIGRKSLRDGGVQTVTGMTSERAALRSLFPFTSVGVLSAVLRQGKQNRRRQHEAGH